MKKLVMAILLCLALFTAQTSFAVTTTSQAIPVTATVVPQFSLTVTVHDGLLITSPLVAAMAFGNLTVNGNGNLTSAKVFTINATALTSSLPYTLTQTCTQLQDPAGDVMPANVFTVSPNANGVVPPAGASYTVKGNAVAVGKLVYSSGANGAHDPTVNVRYTLDSTTGTGVIGIDQKGGAYTATLTYTLTA